MVMALQLRSSGMMGGGGLLVTEALSLITDNMVYSQKVLGFH